MNSGRSQWKRRFDLLAARLGRCVKDIADGMRDGLDKLWYG